MNKCVLTLSIVSKLPQKSQNVKFSFESFCLVSWFPGLCVMQLELVIHWRIEVKLVKV